jgi:hypothetical protein
MVCNKRANQITAKPHLTLPGKEDLRCLPSGGRFRGGYYKKHGGYYVTKQLRFNSNIF